MKTTTAIIATVGVLLFHDAAAQIPQALSVADSTVRDSAARGQDATAVVTTVLGVIAAVGLVFLYFLPTTISSRRKHPNASPIFLLNFCLGWTLIGWFVALMWAISAINPALVPGDAPRPQHSRFCPSCGAVAPTGAFCGSCGSKIVA